MKCQELIRGERRQQAHALDPCDIFVTQFENRGNVHECVLLARLFGNPSKDL